MLSLETLNSIEALLTSEALVVKGNQLNFVFGVIQQIQQEKQRMILANRVSLLPTPPPPVPPEAQDKAA